MNHEHDRLPPHDRYAERGLLGACIRDNSAVPEVQGIIAAGDFYVIGHQKIFEAIELLFAKGTPIDTITLFECLRERKLLEDAGGSDYLMELWDAAPSSANAAHYAKIIHAKALLRGLIHACNNTLRDAWDGASTPEELLEQAEQKVFALSTLGITQGPTTQAQACHEYLEWLDRRTGQTRDGEVQDDFIETGWIDLDRLIVGLHKSELTVIGARPGVGKTVFATHLVRSAAERGYQVFFANLEQRDIELVGRMFSAVGPVEAWKLRRAILNDADRERVLDAYGKLSPLPIHYDDTPGQSCRNLIAAARRLKARAQCQLVVIDYLQLIGADEGSRRHDNRTQEVGYVARQLKLLARSLDVPVVAFSQLNRDTEKRTNPKPRLSDLRDSGEIEQHADAVFLLHKPEAPEPTRKTDILEVIVAKQRAGPIGEVTLVHRKDFFEIANFAVENPV